MGLRYSFFLIFEFKQVDQVLIELASFLCEKDARRLNDAIPWEPEIQQEVVWGSGEAVKESWGIGKLKCDGFERQNNFCFSFIFPADGELEEYEERTKLSIREGNKIRIGCSWTSLQVGSEYALLTSAAATSDMSLLFRSSSSITDSWIDFTSHTKSLALFFDSEEDYDWLLLHPQVRKTIRPELDSFYSSDFKVLRVDEYCWEALHLSKLV